MISAVIIVNSICAQDAAMCRRERSGQCTRHEKWLKLGDWSVQMHALDWSVKSVIATTTHMVTTIDQATTCVSSSLRRWSGALGATLLHYSQVNIPTRWGQFARVAHEQSGPRISDRAMVIRKSMIMFAGNWRPKSMKCFSSSTANSRPYASNPISVNNAIVESTLHQKEAVNGGCDQDS